MNRRNDTAAVRLLLKLISSDAADAMESAKQLIGGKATIDPVLLTEIALSPNYRKWSRIGAIYSLGFLGSGSELGALIRILENRRESSDLRGHAAESLGNLRHKEATDPLRRVLMSNESADLKKWCIYALKEIGDNRSLSIVKKFEKRNTK
jgi:HEAT repeat protein